MTAADRRLQLIGAALRLFATRGFNGTTTKAIAEAAGVSEAIIFRHFTGKKDLYTAILREKARQDGYDETMRLLRGVAARDDDRALVFHLILRTIESFERDPEFHRLMLYAALERHDLARVSRRVMGMPLFKLLLEYVKRRQKAGAFRAGRPDLMVFGMLALPMHFALVTKVIGVKRLEVPSRELAATFTSMMLGGLESPTRVPAKESSNTNSSAAKRDSRIQSQVSAQGYAARAPQLARLRNGRTTLGGESD